MAAGLGLAPVVVSPTGLDDLYWRRAPEARRLAYLLTGDHASAEAPAVPGTTTFTLSFVDEDALPAVLPHHPPAPA